MAVPWILPRGLVVNSPEARTSIEKIDAEPLDLADIARFWKVYTTTKRRLLDPTAERLENHWWRLWGSRQRRLKGATVARLFTYISDGQSFVPLRGPPNRDEGNGSLERQARHRLGASSSSTIHRSNRSRQGTTASSSAYKTPVVMPPPILKGSDTKKKDRGSSASGPRPTARFISPHESEYEDDSISPNSHVVVQPPSPTESKTDKRSHSSDRKKKGGFVVATGRKRPVIVKRQGSQSSTDSVLVKAGDGHTLPSSSDKTPSTSEQAQDHGKQRMVSKFQENFSPSSERSPKPRRASSSRRSRTPDPNHLAPRRATPKHPRGFREGSHVSLPETGSSGEPGPSNHLRSMENDRTWEEDHMEEELQELEVQRMLLADANATIQKEAMRASRVMSPTALNEDFQIIHNSLRSQPDSMRDSGGMGAVRLAPRESKTIATPAPTLDNATGQIDAGNGSQRSGAPKLLDKGKGRELEEVRNTEMFAKRPVQSVAAFAASESNGSLSRSKSQLTLLLERDRAKSVDKPTRDDKYKQNR